MQQPATGTSAPGHWHVAGVSVRGGSHIKRGQPCQDSHVWRQLPGGALVIAVADGAGTASLSQLGSARAAIAAVEWVAELMRGDWPTTADEWQALLTAALETAHESVLGVARKRQVPPRELATTLILVVVTPEVVAAVQVGDGAAVVTDAANDFYAVTAPQSGEFINETVFFTSPGYLNAAQYGFWEGRSHGIGVFSDGLQLLALRMPGGTPHPAFFTPLFEYMNSTEDIHAMEQQLREMLDSPRIQQRADDDLTLILGVWHQPVVPATEEPAVDTVP